MALRLTRRLSERGDRVRSLIRNPAHASDVQAAGERVRIPVPREEGVRETRQPITTIRKRIAERLLDSQNTTATLTTVLV